MSASSPIALLDEEERDDAGEADGVAGDRASAEPQPHSRPCSATMSSGTRAIERVSGAPVVDAVVEAGVLEVQGARRRRSARRWRSAR